MNHLHETFIFLAACFPRISQQHSTLVEFCHCWNFCQFWIKIYFINDVTRDTSKLWLDNFLIINFFLLIYPQTKSSDEIHRVTSGGLYIQMKTDIQLEIVSHFHAFEFYHVSFWRLYWLRMTPLDGCIELRGIKFWRDWKFAMLVIT